MKKIALLLFLIYQIPAFAQSVNEQKLLKALQNAREDSTRIRLYTELCNTSSRENNLKYGQVILEIADRLLLKTTDANEKKKLLHTKASTYSVIAIYYSDGKQADAGKEFEFAEKSLQIYRQIEDDNGIVALLFQMATIYEKQGNIPKALESCKEGFRLAQLIEKDTSVKLVVRLADSYRAQYVIAREMINIYVYLNDTTTALKYFEEAQSIANKQIALAKGKKSSADYKDGLFSLAGAYFSMSELFLHSNYNKAMSYCNKLISIYLETNNTFVIAGGYEIKGLIYYNNGQYDAALKVFDSALTIYNTKNNKEGQGLISGHIGRIYEKQGRIEDALKCFNTSIELGRVEELIDIGRIYFERKTYKEAELYWQRSFTFDLKNGSPDKIAKGAKLLSDVYRAEKKFEKALEMFELHIKMSDSIRNESLRKSNIENQFQREFENKQNLLKEEQIRKDAIAKSAIRQEQTKRYVLYWGLAILLIFGLFMFNRFRVTQKQKQIIEKEKLRSDELLLNILPSEVAEELKETGSAKAKSFDNVTVLFTDFKNFTITSETLSAEDLVREINYCYSEFDKIITRYGIEKIKTIGDSYMCAGGLPTVNKSHPQDVVKAGLELQQFIMQHKEECMRKDKPYFELRLGIHTGPVVAGIVGIKKFAYDIWGDTVNTASRMESSGEVGKVNISGTTYELVKDQFTCTHRGKIEAKNKGEIDMYFVEGQKI